MNGQQGPVKMTWEKLETDLEMDIENSEKRMILLKAQLEEVKKHNK